ncbi:MAG TPA: hypothetical protein VHF58_05155 [Solirubrobacterales bacterium]|nr:hypothetical protein [Solirubrobacterales bacterium]
MRTTWKAKTLGAVCAAASLIAAPSASAAIFDYAPDQQARDFNGGGGGWSSSTEHAGLCLPSITCYGAGATHEAEGGPSGAGDGFLRINLFTIAEAVTDTTAIIQSEPFTYRGAGGETPKRLTFSLDRRTDVGGLLPAVDNAASYSVRAISSGGPAVTLVSSRTLGGAEDVWTAIDPVNLDPNELRIGRTYQISVETTFQSGVTVIGTGTVDYDNVVLRARGGGGGGGGGGNAGPGGGLTTGIRNSLGAAEHKGNKLRVPAGCPRNVAPKQCKLKVAAKFNRKGPKVTSSDKLKVRPGGKKTAVLKIKSQYREEMEDRNKVVVKVKVKAGGKTRTVLKRVKVRHF